MHPNPGRAWLSLFLGLAVGALMAGAATPDQPAMVIAVQVRGTVVVQHGTATETEPVLDGAQLGQADTITTAAQSSVMLVIPNGTVVALKEKSRLKISVALQSALLAGEPPVAAGAEPAEPAEPGVSQTGFELSFGEMLTRVRKLNPGSTFEVQTPVSVAAVRGTVFEIAYQPGSKGDASYQLSTASGLVQVRPHNGQVVEVAARQQMSLRAEIGKNGIKIKNVKSGKLDRRKGERIQREGMDNERNAGESLRRIQPPGPGAAGPGPGPNPNPQASPAAGTPGMNAQGPAANKPNPAAGQPGARDTAPGQAVNTPQPANAPKAPAANAPKPPTVTPPANRAGPPQVVKPNVPAPKPKVPARPPAIKRPPRPPGT